MGEQSVDLESKLKNINYHKPLRCEFCGAGLRYTGVGEYKCTRCRQFTLDDYGKVRKYVQEKGSANAAEISRDTGVDKDVIDDMIKEVMEFAPWQNQKSYRVVFNIELFNLHKPLVSALKIC